MASPGATGRRTSGRRGHGRGTSSAGRPAAEEGTAPAGSSVQQREDPDADPVAVARAIALRQLTMAPRSRAELAQKMASRGVAPDVAEQVLDRLAEVGLVDDEAYAGMLVRSRQETRGLARRALQHELRRKGVDDDVARGALADVTDEDERAAAEDLVARRLRATRGLDRQVRERRLAGVLARKGYPAGVAYAVVRAALEDETGAP
ncbi:regulatory protein RecX [Pseudokineococcus basanitobsidens]|uniref:Regulatory protein RecX n=1 Tax=Pseudokineococcus basanitobsidens TaxID=1926649 RepID=A0ABU8RJF7_9ACTN